MKKFTLFRLVLWLIVLLAPLYVCAESISYTAAYNQSLIIGSDTLGGVQYSTVKYGDLYNIRYLGKPSLPVEYIRFSVPYNATNFTVSTTLSNNSIRSIPHMVYPCQVPAPNGFDNSMEIVQPDSIAYYSGQYYPNENAWIADEGFLIGENHIVTVAVMPIAYQHTLNGNKLRRSQQIVVTLNYELSDNPSKYPIVSSNEQVRIDGHQLTQSMVVNPSNVLSFAPPQTLIDSIDNRNSITGQNSDNSYDYLIVTTNHLEKPLRKIAALKNQTGYKTKVVTMDDVMSDQYSQGGDVIFHFDMPEYADTVFSDSAGVLRQYIRNAFNNNGLRNVLLVGDGVPYRTIKTILPYSQDSINVQSDLYYSDINGNWTPDHIDQWIDTHHDLLVGRILASSEIEISNYTDKLLRYELNPGNGDTDYLDKAFFITDSEGYSSVVRDFFSQYFPDTTDIVQSELTSKINGKGVVDIINNNKYGFLSFLNQATPSGFILYNNQVGKNYLWAIDSVKIEENCQAYCLDTITGNGLNNLYNKWYPNICYSVGNSTASFAPMPQYQCIATNLGRSFTTGKDYGGPAFIGNTNIDPHLGTMSLESRFAIGLLNAKREIGNALAAAKENDFESIYNCLIANLLGDPALSFYHYWPYYDPLVFNYSVIRNDNSISVSIDTNLNMCDVIYCDNEGNVIHGHGGSPIFRNVSPNGTIYIRLYYGIKRTIAPLLMQNYSITNSQYVIASDVIAGYEIDSNRTNGNVVVNNGVEYEIEASGTVTLEDGFKVEKGATFAVYPSSF